jgi:hypothetical protein
MGRDLSAQLAHAQLGLSHWPALLDLRWYGGFDPLGYSVLSPPVMALLGVRLTTALAYIASAVLFAALLKRTAMPRPVAGGLVAAVCLTGNLVVARTTFALGLALGLGALLAFASGHVRVAAALSVLAALSSPVAGLFLGVAGGALFLSGRRRGGVTVGVSAMVPTIAVGLAFGNDGYQTVGRGQAVMVFLVCLVVAGLCWRRPVARWGGLLSAGLVAGAYLLLHTPVVRPRHVCPSCSARRLSWQSRRPSGGRRCAAASVACCCRQYRSQRSEKRAIPRSAKFYAPLLTSWPLGGLRAH